MHDNAENENFRDIMKMVKNISNINGENLRTIEHREGNDVIIQRSFSLEQVNASLLVELQDLQHALTNDREKMNDMNIIIEKRTVKAINDLIRSWNYDGEALEREKIVLGDFIDLHMTKFDDVKELHTRFEDLHEKYSRILNDIPISREAAQILLRNVKKLKTAIKAVYSLKLDAKLPQMKN